MNNIVRQRILLITAAAVLLIVLLFILFFSSSSDNKSYKIGYIMTGETDEAGWNGMNYKGIEYVCDKYDIELIVKENVAEDSGMCAEAISELADNGVQMIILSSYGYPEEVRSTIAEYPEIPFYGISAEFYTDNFTSYFGRMYQARYLSGIVAGMMTETDKIGYVAAIPNVEVNRGINAFTLGVRRVNPDAEVVVSWTGFWDDEEKGIYAAEELIKNENTDLIAYHQNRHYAVDAAEKAGVYSIGYNEAAEGYSDKYLTAAVWEWKYLYEAVIKDFIQGQANTTRHQWCGIETGAIGLSEYSPLITDEIKAEIEKAKKEILSGKDVFSGEIYDNTGYLRCGADEFLSDIYLMTEFDWYVDGVELYEE